jgi:hypothetical protein
MTAGETVMKRKSALVALSFASILIGLSRCEAKELENPDKSSVQAVREETVATRAVGRTITRYLRTSFVEWKTVGGSSRVHLKTTTRENAAVTIKVEPVMDLKTISFVFHRHALDTTMPVIRIRYSITNDGYKANHYDTHQILGEKRITCIGDANNGYTVVLERPIVWGEVVKEVSIVAAMKSNANNAANMDLWDFKLNGHAVKTYLPGFRKVNTDAKDPMVNGIRPI